MMRTSVVVVAVVAALTAACGTPDGSDPEASLPGEKAPLVLTDDGEVEVSCGGTTGWPPSIMTEGVPGVLTDGEAKGIFESILNDPQYGGEAGLTLFRDGVNVDWRVLRDDGDTLFLGLGRWTNGGPAGPDAYHLGLEREGEAWRPTGWGDCELSPVLQDGYMWAQVMGYRGDPTRARLTAQVSERECTGGRDPEAFLHEPHVVETSESVTIYWTSDPVDGAQSCQGNPSIDRVVELQHALGDRLVFDGFNYPPRRLHVTQNRIDN
jgi:hypothetical protein